MTNRRRQINGGDIPGCPACASLDIDAIGRIPSGVTFAGRTLDAPLGGGILFRCRSCRLGFRYPRPPKARLDALYEQGAIDAWSVMESEKRNDWNLAKKWLRENLREGDILDVGCFDGTFLSSLGGGYGRFGVEINTMAAKQARGNGVTIVGNNVNDMVSGKYYDAITAFDIIEHVENPLKFVIRLSGYVKADGYVIVSTGNFNAWTWRIMKGKYWYCAAPEHISFISPEWCSEAATKMGIRIREIKRFQHKLSSKFEEVFRASVNVLYYLTPDFYAFLRAKIVGNKSYVMPPGATKLPPTWNTARDHFLVVFQVGALRGDADSQAVSEE